MSPNKIKAVVFDLDGVLVDARDWHYEALNRALNHFGYNISRYDHLVTFDGLPTRKKLEMLTQERQLPLSLHDFLNDLKQKYTTELLHSLCKPSFQHQYALSNLKAAGYKLGLASNAVRQSIEIMMTATELISYLDVILSNQDVKKSKPDPEIYLVSAEKLNCKPSEMLVIEDNQNGIIAAQKAGAHLLVVDSPLGVTLDRISDRISQIEAKN